MKKVQLGNLKTNKSSPNVPGTLTKVFFFKTKNKKRIYVQSIWNAETLKAALTMQILSLNDQSQNIPILRGIMSFYIDIQSWLIRNGTHSFYLSKLEFHSELAIQLAYDIWMLQASKQFSINDLTVNKNLLTVSHDYYKFLWFKGMQSPR